MLIPKITTWLARRKRSLARDEYLIESPIGRALMGAKVGDVVSAETPNGTFKFEILKIE